MHYPTDVAAGAVLGVISGYVAWKAAGNVLNWWEQRQSATVGEYKNGEV
jgi:undecaprenyl-diphosphatase